MFSCFVDPFLIFSCMLIFPFTCGPFLTNIFCSHNFKISSKLNCISSCSQIQEVAEQVDILLYVYCKLADGNGISFNILGLLY